MTRGWVKPSFPFGLQGQIIVTKDAVKYVGLPLSLATWGDKNYFAMLKGKKPLERCIEISIQTGRDWVR